MTDEEELERQKVLEREQEAHEIGIRHDAAEAQSLLDKPLLIKAFAYLKQRYNANILKAASSNHEAIEENHRMYKAIVQVEQELREVVNSGKIVDAKREQRDYQAAVVKEDEG